MGEFKIGTSDRGWTDREDQLLLQKRPLKTGLTQHEAETFVVKNPGAEILVKQKDGTFSVYGLKTSEKGKAIENQDFETASIELTQDVLKVVQGKQAYVSTSTNYLRTLDIPGIDGVEIDDLNQQFATADLQLSLMDRDGLETLSQNDLQGSLNGKIVLDKFTESIDNLGKL